MSISNEFEGGRDEYMARLQDEADQIAIDEAIDAEAAERSEAGVEDDPCQDPDYDVYHSNMDYIGGEW